MSSLSLQLQHLAQSAKVSKTNLKNDSILFDAKHASKVDTDTIYSIGIDGLEELQKLDGRFSAFRETLFSQSSRMIDRNLQNTETNEKLKESINSLLILLSPFVLLRPSQKVLEYLIRQFR
jgi:U3 small nucleolar RNA-associated protein 10